MKKLSLSIMPLSIFLGHQATEDVDTTEIVFLKNKTRSLQKILESTESFLASLMQPIHKIAETVAGERNEYLTELIEKEIFTMQEISSTIVQMKSDNKEAYQNFAGDIITILKNLECDGKCSYKAHTEKEVGDQTLKMRIAVLTNVVTSFKNELEEKTTAIQNEDLLPTVQNLHRLITNFKGEFESWVDKKATKECENNSKIPLLLESLMVSTR